MPCRQLSPDGKAFLFFNYMQRMTLPKINISKKWLMITAGSFVVIIGILLWLDKVVMPAWVHSQPVLKMPNLIGMNSREAIAELSRMKFAVAAADTRPDEKYPKDIVLYQNPFAGEEVKEGRKVFITISSGKEIMQLPNFIGMNTRDAKIKLQNIGLTVGDITFANSESVPEDNIIQQTPAVGSRVSLDARVSLVVSGGQEKPMVIIPSLVGKTLAEAQTNLQTLHLVFGTISYEKNHAVLPSTILNQQPPSGDSVKEGSSINLTVAKDD